LGGGPVGSDPGADEESEDDWSEEAEFPFEFFACVWVVGDFVFVGDVEVEVEEGVSESADFEEDGADDDSGEGAECGSESNWSSKWDGPVGEAG